MLTVLFPKMKLAMQAQMYGQLRADEQEAVRVLFDYDDGQEQHAIARSRSKHRPRCWQRSSAFATAAR